jgi:hypothetical protein
VADGGVAILGIEFDDPVVSPEGPEELNLQLGKAILLVRYPRDPLRSAQFAVEGSIPALVHHANPTIGSSGIGRHRGDAASLEPLWEARDLVPASEVAIEIDVVHDVQRGLGRCAAF